MDLGGRVDLGQLERVCMELPIFPLPRLVLMPGDLLPLHVFEPRYRALVSHCQAMDGAMGIATLQPGQGDQEAAPSFFPEIGVGLLVACQRYPDGRSTIVLQYIGRCLFERELDSPHLFRLIRGTTSRVSTRGSEGAVLRLRTLVLQLGALSVDATEEARRLVSLDGSDMVDSLARKLIEKADDRRAYLAASDLVVRVKMVEDKLAQFLHIATPTAHA